MLSFRDEENRTIEGYEPESAQPSNSAILWWVSLACVSSVLLVLALVVSRSYISHQALDLDERGADYQVRIEDAEQHEASAGPSIWLVLGSIHAMCYQEVAGADTLTDFGIESAYLNQQVQTAILMWMVVAITLSGVILAGLQLIAGYKLASTGKAAFEQGGNLSVQA